MLEMCGTFSLVLHNKSKYGFGEKAIFRWHTALFEEGSQGNEPYIPRARLSYPYSAV